MFKLAGSTGPARTRGVVRWPMFVYRRKSTGSGSKAASRSESWASKRSCPRLRCSSKLRKGRKNLGLDSGRCLKKCSRCWSAGWSHGHEFLRSSRSERIREWRTSSGCVTKRKRVLRKVDKRPWPHPGSTWRPLACFAFLSFPARKRGNQNIGKGTGFKEQQSRFINIYN